jgi:hypothetical protein
VFVARRFESIGASRTKFMRSSPTVSSCCSGEPIEHGVCTLVRLTRTILEDAPALLLERVSVVRPNDHVQGHLATADYGKILCCLDLYLRSPRKPNVVSQLVSKRDRLRCQSLLFVGFSDACCPRLLLAFLFAFQKFVHWTSILIRQSLGRSRYGQAVGFFRLEFRPVDGGSET